MIQLFIRKLLDPVYENNLNDLFKLIFVFVLGAVSGYYTGHLVVYLCIIIIIDLVRNHLLRYFENTYEKKRLPKE